MGNVYNFTDKHKPDSIKVYTEKEMLCMKCRACCNSLAFRMNRPTKDVLDFYRTRGCKIFEEDRDTVTILLENVPCPHISENGCDLYEKRPLVCKHFDGRTTNALKGICLWESMTS